MSTDTKDSRIPGVSLKSTGLRFKRYDVKDPNKVNGGFASIRAIEVRLNKMPALAEYITACAGEATYDSEKDRLYLYEMVQSKLSLGGYRWKWSKRQVRIGDYIVQFHDASWAKLTQEEFKELVVS